MQAWSGAWALGLLVATAVGQAGEMRMGPPPYGDPLIVGEPVPNWSADARRSGAVLDWEPLGPRPILNEFWSGNDDASGRVVSIAPHPADPDIVYIAAASGGIWKTTDGGLNWSPLTDHLPSLNHGCVAVDPNQPDSVFVGTGEYTTGSTGAGVFRSLDGGTSWTQLADSGVMGNDCSGLAVDPTDSNIVHWTGGAGYLRSVDGGDTWQLQLPGRASALAWTPDALFVAQHGVGVFRSLDDGDSFSQLGGLPDTGIGRILLASAPSNERVLYVAVLVGADLLGLYRSNNLGSSFALLPNTPNFPTPQGWYDAFIAVHPDSEDEIWAGGVFPTYAVAGVTTSTDGGSSWNDVTFGSQSGQLHADMHTLAFGPTGTIWVGNDGGVWRTDDRGANWINTNATLAVTQNYQIAVNPHDPGQVMGGTQDNGTVSRDLGSNEWPQIIAGDGGYLVFDFLNPTRRYTTYVRLSVYRFVGAGFAEITGPWTNEPRRFIAPLIMDPTDPDVLLGGTNRVWRTLNASDAAVWTPLSDDSVAGTGRLSALAVAAQNPERIYAGGDFGTLFVRNPVSGAWVDRTPAGTSFISDIEVSPAQPEVAIIGAIQTSGPRVLFTDDAGASWSDLSATLPAGVAARALAVDWRTAPPVVYLGSGAGVWWSEDFGATWTNTGSDLPNVNIGDLRLLMDEPALFAGTYGRGVWVVPLPDAFIFRSGFDGPE